jgi:DNA polymerase III epsilon subunit-like protein
MSVLDAVRCRFARTAVPRRTSLRSVRYVVLDTELTSLDKRKNRLLSAGAIGMQGAQIALGEQFYRVVNPGVAVPAESIVVHGLRPEDVERGESPEAVLKALREFVGDAIVVGHCVRIDVDVLRKELRAHGSAFTFRALDTARAYHWLKLQQSLAEGHDHVSATLDLASIAQELGIQVDDAHHALVDAFVTAQVWQRIIPRLEAAGVTTIGGALRVARG